MVAINIRRRVTFSIYWDSNAFALVSIAIILDFVLEVFYHNP
jgi:hypothetical protein